MRPGTGILPKQLDDVVGMSAIRDISSGETLNWSDIK